jgi:hypothetical protein
MAAKSAVRGGARHAAMLVSSVATKDVDGTSCPHAVRVLVHFYGYGLKRSSSLASYLGETPIMNKFGERNCRVRVNLSPIEVTSKKNTTRFPAFNLLYNLNGLQRNRFNYYARMREEIT